MTLATVDADGRPSARIVLLKGVDARGFVFYTNRESRKGHALAQRCARRAAVLLGRSGAAGAHRGRRRDVDDAEADAYFATRPRASRLGAWASPQSAPIADRAALERRYRRRGAALCGGGEAIPRPPHWGGYRVVPVCVRVLAGAPVPAARSHRVSQGRRCVVDRRGSRRDGASGVDPSASSAVLIGTRHRNHVVLAGSRVAVTLYALSQGAGSCDGRPADGALRVPARIARDSRRGGSPTASACASRCSSAPAASRSAPALRSRYPACRRCSSPRC